MFCPVSLAGSFVRSVTVGYQCDVCSAYGGDRVGVGGVVAIGIHSREVSWRVNTYLSIFPHSRQCRE